LKREAFMHSKLPKGVGADSPRVSNRPFKPGVLGEGGIPTGGTHP
jgi:hypothetical protein